jgi:hypothetical protein
MRGKMKTGQEKARKIISDYERLFRKARELLDNHGITEIEKTATDKDALVKLIDDDLLEPEIVLGACQILYEKRGSLH